MCVYIYIYIYIERERERGRDRDLYILQDIENSPCAIQQVLVVYLFYI